jgi:DNA-binding response OmpR family regulator
MTERVLIVSGDSKLKGVLVPMLESAQVEPVPVPSVAEAARRLDDGELKLIVLDREQPEGQSAFVFLRQLGSGGSTVPVLLVCGTASPEDLVAGFRLGAAEVIRKPVRAGVIGAALTRLLPEEQD